MKKALLSIFAVASMTTGFSQNDTIIAHMAGTPTVYTTQAGGYVVGHNGYGDKEKAMKFDAVTSPSIISSVLFWAAWVEGNSSSLIDVKIYDDNSGQPGNLLGSTTVTFGSIDTTQAGLSVISNAMVYNATANFSTPVALPSGDFYVALGFNYAAGDTVGIVTSTNGDFPNAGTYTWEKLSNDTWIDFTTSWSGNLNVGIAIFPVISDGFVSVEESELNSQIYSFENELFINSSENLENAMVNIVSSTGQNIENHNINGTSNRINLNHLSTGLYFVTVSSNGQSKTNKIVIK